MGNRITGFLAGVFLTGATTVYTARLVSGIQATNSSLIKNADDVINNRILTHTHETSLSVPVNRRGVVVSRPSVAETCKDIWNDEIIKMTNRVYSINWYRWGLEIDKKVNKLTDKMVEMAFEKK